MGFKTVDLDTKEGRDRYKRMKETKSVQKAFEDEKDSFIESLPPREQKSSFVEPEPAATESISVEEEIFRTGVVVEVDQLRVRTKPSGDVMYFISKGSVVTIMQIVTDSDGENWCKVETAPNRMGWVMKKYIKIRTEGG